MPVRHNTPRPAPALVLALLAAGLSLVGIAPARADAAITINGGSAGRTFDGVGAQRRRQQPPAHRVTALPGGHWPVDDAVDGGASDAVHGGQVGQGRLALGI
ncbi:hypothetical protein ACTWPT_54390 [Nonomuraea sp. 3N208]|uniref:hypothetical protein n=1 Tax=Nonomuraea sp. 3N208 TaxID=3457421 RepID=UPI003FD0E139